MDNSSLIDITALQTSLHSLGYFFEFMDNTVMPQCQAEELLDMLISLGWSGSSTITGNDTTATCP